MAGESRGFLPTFIKYALLAGISYLVTYNVTQNRLDKNQIMLISFAITVIFAFIDLYSGLFSGMLTAFCNCQQVAA